MIKKTEKHALRLALLALVLLLVLSACTFPSSQVDSPRFEQPIARAQAGGPKADYVGRVSYAPVDAKRFDLIDEALTLTPDELARLEQNGFVLSDRLAFEDFTTAYAYIYWKDLPVLVTTDSIHQAVHQLYDDLLMEVEMTILTSKLNAILTNSRQQLRAEAGAVDDPDLAQLYTDLDIYLTVPLVLLTGEPYDTPGVERYVDLAQSADAIAKVGLFGSLREIDFTLFQPRGHYTKSEALGRYFRAMSWLAHVDFRWVAYDPQGNPILNLEQIAAAALLRDAIDGSGQRPAWEEFDALFGELVGRSDNVRLPDLDRFLADAAIDSAPDLLDHPDPDLLLTMLTTRDYGQQRITGQILYVAIDNPDPIPRPVSFLLFGQRFAVDSYVMSNLVFDRLLVDGEKVNRRLPSPLDVTYVLGNDRSLTHLEPELALYGYEDNLAALRDAVSNNDPAFWSDTVYNRWLAMLQALNADTTGRAYPQAMRTAAWADKMLHTQLASWAQLRHDNILYVKQPFTANAICEYPAGYVEPYPEFYAAVGDLARAVIALFEGLDPTQLSEGEQRVQEMAITRLARLEAAAGMLKTMAEKELRLEPFSAEEEMYLKSIVVRETEARGCVPVPGYSGWYLDLFLDGEDSPALLADVHTDPGRTTGIAKVLHVATGPVAAIIFIADTDEGPTMYVGPAFTYYEVVKEGPVPVRLTNEDWRKELSASPYPVAPAWTGSFRLPVATPPDHLELPTR